MTEPTPGPVPGPPRPAPAHFQLYATDLGGPVNWRLLSRNNRDLGRSVAPFADEDACLAAIADLIQRIGEHQVVVRPDGSHRWAWRLRDRTTDALVAVAGHPFDRQVRCQQGWVQFYDATHHATISPGLLVIGARRGRSPRPAQRVRPGASSDGPGRATVLAGHVMAPDLRRFEPRTVMAPILRVTEPNVERA